MNDAIEVTAGGVHYTLLYHDMLTPHNHKIGRAGSKVEYLVAHYPYSVGDAEAQCKYFMQPLSPSSSAHFFVGHEGGIWRSVAEEDTAWHCGAKSYRHPFCRNLNSIGVEICCKADEKGKRYFTQPTYWAAVELFAFLAIKYDIPMANIVRHYDVTGKICPAPFVEDEDYWYRFKKDIADTIRSMKNVKKPAPRAYTGMKYKALKDAYVRIGDTAMQLHFATVNDISKSMLEKHKCVLDNKSTKVIFLEGKIFTCVDAEYDELGNIWAKTKSGFWLPLEFNGKKRAEVI